MSTTNLRPKQAASTLCLVHSVLKTFVTYCQGSENSEQQVGKNPTIEEEPLQPPFPKKDVEADAKHLAEQRNLGSFGDQLKAFNAVGNGKALPMGAAACVAWDLLAAANSKKSCFLSVLCGNAKLQCHLHHMLHSLCAITRHAHNLREGLH